MKFILLFTLVLSMTAAFAETWDANVQLPPVEKSAKKKEIKAKDSKEKNIPPEPKSHGNEPLDESKRLGKVVDPNAEPHRDGYFMRNHSAYDSLFWVGGAFGLTTNTTGIGGQGSVNLKLKFGRCGAIGSWHSENVYIYDPADIHNSIFGAGVQCTVLKFPSHWGFFGGSHLTATAMVENGTSTIHLYELTGQWGQSHREVRAQRLNSWGGSAGADFYVPLIWGFWANYSLGLEHMFFDYDLSGVNGTRTEIPQQWFYLRIGLSYAI